MKRINRIKKLIRQNSKEKTFKEQYDSKNNSFSLLLFIAALGILFFHCYPLYFGPNSNGDFITRFFDNYGLGKIIVAIFFSVSGFFMAQSITKSKNSTAFLVKRVVRIFPSLLFLLLLIAFVVAPLLLKVNYVEYIMTPSYYSDFIFHNLFLIQNGVGTIGELFANNPYPYAIIGSLWTLKHTVCTYLIIYICNQLGFIARKRPMIILYIICAFFTFMYYFGVLTPLVEQIESTYWYIGVLSEFGNFIEVLTYFLAGVLLYLYKDVFRYSPTLLLSALIVIFISRYLFLTNVVCMFLIPYCAVSVGSIRLNSRFSYLGSLSYPIFLYGFPVQQTIIYLWPNVSLFMYIILSILGTLLFAMIVNELIDKRFQKLWKKIKLFQSS